MSRASRTKTLSAMNRPLLGAAACLVLFLWLVGATATTALGQLQPEAVPADVVTNSPGQTPVEEESLDDIALFDLEIPIVVTAARREQKITTVPYAVSVITAEDIRWSGARSVPDALRLVPGVDVADLTSGQTAVSLRGLHGLLSREVLVLVDGRQIFDCIFGGTAWGSWPLQLEDIERIEVVRGPGGVTWGPNAVNGVINIITKDPADQLGLTFTAGGGSRGMHKEHLGYAFVDGKLRMRVSGEYEASDGFRQGGSVWRNLDDDYKTGRFRLHAIYEPDAEDAVTISAGSGVLDGGYPGTPLAGFGLRRHSRTQASFLLGKWTHRITDDNRFELTGFVNDFHLLAGTPQIDYRYQQLALQFGHTFKPTAAHTLTWGIDTRLDMLDTSNADPFMSSKSFVSTGIIGLYLQDEWRFAPKWTLDLGGRIDYGFYGGFEPSARAALSYQLTESSLIYGAVARTFQMPPAGTRFLNLPLVNGLSYMTANRDVGPEILMAYELGYRGSFFDQLEMNLNLFWHEYDPLAVLKPLPGSPGLIRVHFDNTYSASMYGLEFDAKYAVTKDLTLLGHYTFQQFDSRGSFSIKNTDYISPPKHKFMLGARCSPTQDLHLSGHLYYVDTVRSPNPASPLVRRHVDPYFRLDLRAEYEFYNDRASVTVGVKNLLDSGHYEGGTLFLNDAQVPRTIFAELRIKLD